jgi:hypothetical protein
VSGGLESLAGAGAGLLESLSPAVAANLPRAAAVIHALSSYGFSGLQLAGAIQNVAPLRTAISNGDVKESTRLLTNITIGGALAGLGVSRELGSKTDIAGNPRPVVFGPDREAIGAYQHNMEVAAIKAQALEKENAALLKDKPLDVAARLRHEAANDPAVLAKWASDITNATKSPPDVRGKYTGFVGLAQRIPVEHPEIAALSQKLRGEYANDLEYLKANEQIGPV